MQKMKLKYFSLAALIIATFAGCSGMYSSYLKADKRVYTINANGKSRIKISDPNGEIRITGSDSISVITIVAQIFIPDRGDGIKSANDDVKIKIDSAGHELRVKTEYDKGFLDIGNSGYADYNIVIPKNMRVDISSVNGDIFLASVESESSIGTVNSTVNILDCSGKIVVDGVNSDINSNFNSTNGMNISVVNGDVKLGGMKNVAANVKISTVNGDMSFKGLTFSNIEIKGKSSFKGSIGNGGKAINISTVNGDIRLDADYISLNKK